MWDSRHLGTVIDFGSQMCAMEVEDRPQLCGSTSLGMGGFGKTWRRLSGWLLKCDVLSYGVILWELFTKQEPWKGVNPYRVIHHVGDEDGRLDIPDNMDPDIANIIRQCWKKQV